MSLILIIGPQAVGKMTVGQELAKLTGLKLFHNHMSIDLVSQFFSYSSETGRDLVSRIRWDILSAVADSDLDGLIFTVVCAFDLPSDRAYLDKISQLFEGAGRPVYIVELEATLETRVARNATLHRLRHKPVKRDVERFEAELRRTAQKHRLNSDVGEIEGENYLRIDNTDMPAPVAAQRIKAHFGF